MVRDRLPYTDPLRAGRHPFQTYLLSLCVISGAPMAVGKVTANSIEDKLPQPLVIAWGIMLVSGAAVALIGAYLRGSYATALTLERIGLWSVGGAALAYGVCILAAGNIGSLVVAGIILGFGAACVRRARDIGSIFHRALSDHPAIVEKEDGR